MKTILGEFEANEPVKFIIQGLPLEEQFVGDIEQYYEEDEDKSNKEFEIFNTHKEIIYNGAVDENNKVVKLEEAPKPTKY